MEFVTQQQDGACSITLRGQFTFNDHTAFRDVLSRIADPGVQQVVLHMRQVDFVDSAALGMLLLAGDEAQKHRKPITLSGATGQVKKMFDMARFDTIFLMN